MRKLALAAASFSAAVFLSHYLLPGTALVWCAAGCAAASAVSLLLKRQTRLRLLLPALGLAAGFLWTFIYTSVFYAPAQLLDGKTEHVTAVAAGYTEETAYGQKLLVRVAVPGHPAVKTQLYLYDNGGGAPEVRPGDALSFTGRFRLADTIYGEETDAFRAGGIFLLATLQGELTIEDAPASLLQLPAVLRHAVIEKIGSVFPTDTAPFLRALLVGDTTGIREDTVLSGALSVTGTAHIISVSGMNVAFLMSLLGFLIKSKRRLAACGIPVIGLFMAVVGFAPPVTRAGIMQIFLLSAPLFRREADPVTSLSASLMLILLVNPFSAGSAGLQLSFAATLGLLLFTGKLYTALDGPLQKRKIYKYCILKKGIRFVIGVLAATAGALSLSLPLIALHFGTVSLIAPLANIAVLWAVSLAFIGGLAAVAAAFIAAPAGAAAAFVVALPARFVIGAVRVLAQVPFASVYTSNPAVVLWLVYVYLMLAAFLAFRLELRRYVLPACASVVALCLVLILTESLSDRQRLSVTALDVGQGQCVVITAGRYTQVVDCGSKSGKDAGDLLTKYLQGHGRTKVDLLVLTHFHEDHAGGVAEFLARNSVSVLAVPDPAPDSGSLAREILDCAAARGVTICYITQDMRVSIGSLSVCLYAPLGRETENERGLTVLCSAGGFDTLITGDMSDDVERLLISEKSLPDTEVLIAGHHGSKYASSDALLRAATPEAAVISVGYNTYGHPAPETLLRFAQAGIAVYRTDISGDITIRAP